MIFPLFPQWLPDTYEVVTEGGGKEWVDGNTYRGLGVHLRDDMAWQITHLCTGHCVRQVPDLDDTRLYLIATDLAEAADWSFSGLEGWQNVAPDLPEVMKAWHLRWHLGIEQHAEAPNDDTAREIGLKRLQ